MEELTNEQYHKSAGVSSSDFRLLEESPKHLENKDMFGLGGSHFDLGSLVHSLVLEPHKTDSEFVKEDFEGAELNKNSKAYKEAKAEWVKTTIGKTIISLDVWTQAEKMTRNVMAIAGNIFKGGTAEESFFVEDAEFGVVRKCRPDYYSEETGLVIDVKTTRDGSDAGFAKSMANFGYHRQASWYVDTLQMAGKKVDRFVFVMVDTVAPYMVRVREIGEVSMQVGQDNYRKHLAVNKEYNDSDKSMTIRKIDIPQWAIDREYE